MGGGGHNEDTNVITAEDEIALIYTVRGGEPYKIPLKINDRFIEFEIDTGGWENYYFRTYLPRQLEAYPISTDSYYIKNVFWGKPESDW